MQPISFTDQLPLCFPRRRAPIPNIALGGVGKPPVDERQAKLIEAMYQGTRAAQPPVAEGFQVRDEVYQTRSSRDAGRPTATRCRPKASSSSAPAHRPIDGGTSSTSASSTSAAGIHMSTRAAPTTILPAAWASSDVAWPACAEEIGPVPGTHDCCGGAPNSAAPSARTATRAPTTATAASIG